MLYKSLPRWNRIHQVFYLKIVYGHIHRNKIWDYIQWSFCCKNDFPAEILSRKLILEYLRASWGWLWITQRTPTSTLTAPEVPVWVTRMVLCHRCWTLLALENSVNTLLLTIMSYTASSCLFEGEHNVQFFFKSIFLHTASNLRLFYFFLTGALTIPSGAWWTQTGMELPLSSPDEIQFLQQS